MQVRTFPDNIAQLCAFIGNHIYYMLRNLICDAPADGITAVVAQVNRQVITVFHFMQFLIQKYLQIGRQTLQPLIHHAGKWSFGSGLEINNCQYSNGIHPIRLSLQIWQKFIIITTPYFRAPGGNKQKAQLYNY